MMRIRYAAALGVLLWGCTALMEAFTGVGTATAEDWPSFRGPRGDGTWQGPKLPANWPEGGPRRVWQQAVGGGYAGVIAVGSRVFTMDHLKGSPAAATSATTEAAGDEAQAARQDEVERVLALDAASGRVLWTHAYEVRYGDLDYGNGPRAAPTWHDGRLYTLGALGNLHCLDADTGQVLWSHDLVQQSQARIPTWGLAASPVIWRNLVVVHAGLAEGGCVSAYDQQTGREVWRSGQDPAGYSTPLLLNRRDAAAEPDELVCWSPEHVLGMEVATGRPLWQVPYKVTYGVSIAKPIFHRGLVFVAGYWEGSQAIRLDPSTQRGELAWADQQQLRGLMSQPLCRDGYVYLLDKGLGLTCFEIETGRKLWDDKHQLTPRGRNPQATLVWLDEADRVICLNSEGELVLARVNPSGYHEQSRARVIGPTWAHPAYAGDFAYVRDDQELVCVQLTEVATGEPAR